MSLRFLPLTLLAADPPKPAAPKPTPRMRAEAMRNENVAVYLIDTNAAKEANRARNRWHSHRSAG